jgi:hypothetical protein
MTDSHDMTHTTDTDAMSKIHDALAAHLLATGESDKEAAAERATLMINGWEWFSENSMDERGVETCREWMDPEIVHLLDQSLCAKYGLPLDVIAKRGP